MSFDVVKVSDIDLENAILCQLLHGVQESKMGLLSPDLIAKLRDCVDILYSNGKPFSTRFYQDIFEYIHSCFESDKLITIWDIQKHLEAKKTYSSQQNNIKENIRRILEFNDFYLRSMPTATLVQMMVDSSKEKEIRHQLNKQLTSDTIEIDDLRSLIESIDITGVGTAKRIESKVRKFQSSLTPVERAIAKINLKQEGLSPFEINELIDESVPPKDPPKVTSIHEFLLKDFGRSNWIYPGIIPANVVTLVTGQAGGGKTGFAYSLLFSYLDGCQFLNEPPSVLVNNPTKRGLIINADQPASDAQEMLNSSPLVLKHRHKCDIIESGWTLFDILHLEMLIQQIGYTFIVIDSYKAIHSHIPDWDENSPASSLGLKELQRIASAYGVTIIVIHHAGHTERKGGHQSRGHSSITDTASCVMSISSTQMDRNKSNCNHNMRFLEISKIRNSERVQLAIEFNPLTYQYTMRMDDNGQKRQQVNNLANQFTIEFNHGGRVTPQHFLNKFQSVQGQSAKKIAVHSALKKLEMRGFIKKEVDENDLDAIYYSRVMPKILTTEEIGF